VPFPVVALPNSQSDEVVESHLSQSARKMGHPRSREENKLEDQQLNTLFDYTKFHIGLYATLISGLFGVIAYANEHRSDVLDHLLRYAKW
jgi:hypothetical protein